jgi:hypothetical protein
MALWCQGTLAVLGMHYTLLHHDVDIRVWTGLGLILTGKATYSKLPNMK